MTTLATNIPSSPEFEEWLAKAQPGGIYRFDPPINVDTLKVLRNDQRPLNDKLPVTSIRLAVFIGKYEEKAYFWGIKKRVALDSSRYRCEFSGWFTYRSQTGAKLPNFTEEECAPPE